MSLVRGAWYAREDFASKIKQLLSKVDSKTYFNDPRQQWLRDAWIADSFAREVAAQDVRLPDSRWPDFEIRHANGRIIQCEATEAMEPGRRRGAEYREGWKVRHLNQQQLEARRDAIPIALRTAVETKVSKRYPKGAALVIYLNISSHFWDHDAIPDLSELTKEAFGPFDEVWVLWSGRLHRCWPKPVAQPAPRLASRSQYGGDP